jgi:NADPH:quinone reductase-like Zn-dependent oxidoreductase
MPHPRKRIVVTKPGGYNVFRYETSSIPEPLPDEVQVQVRACGINFADTMIRRGLYAAAKGKYPICPGFEFSGVVTRLGQTVKDLHPGDRVFGASRFGAYATLINSPQEYLWKLPARWDFPKGATFPVAYLTAYYALHHVGHLRPEDVVLVHSAAGGVGTAILHLLRLNGNTSVGVVGRSEKISFAREAGATFVIDKSAQDLWAKAKQFSPEGFDLILDANGASTLRGSYHHLRPGGRLLIYGFASMLPRSGKKNILKLLWTYLCTPRFNPLALTGSNRTVSGFNVVYLFDKVPLFREIMERLLRWEAEGSFPPMPITSFPFQDVIKAHQSIESGQSVGKLVLVL